MKSHTHKKYLITILALMHLVPCISGMKNLDKMELMGKIKLIFKKVERIPLPFTRKNKSVEKVSCHITDDLMPLMAKDIHPFSYFVYCIIHKLKFPLATQGENIPVGIKKPFNYTYKSIISMIKKSINSLEKYKSKCQVKLIDSRQNNFFQFPHEDKDHPFKFLPDDHPLQPLLQQTFFDIFPEDDPFNFSSQDNLTQKECCGLIGVKLLAFMFFLVNLPQCYLDYLTDTYNFLVNFKGNSNPFRQNLDNYKASLIDYNKNIGNIIKLVGNLIDFFEKELIKELDNIFKISFMLGFSIVKESLKTLKWQYQESSKQIKNLERTSKHRTQSPKKSSSNRTKPQSDKSFEKLLELAKEFEREERIKKQKEEQRIKQIEERKKFEKEERRKKIKKRKQEEAKKRQLEEQSKTNQNKEVENEDEIDKQMLEAFKKELEEKQRKEMTLIDFNNTKRYNEKYIVTKKKPKCNYGAIGEPIKPSPVEMPNEYNVWNGPTIFDHEKFNKTYDTNETLEHVIEEFKKLSIDGNGSYFSTPLFDD